MIWEALHWMYFYFIFHGLGASALFLLFVCFIPRKKKLTKIIDCFSKTQQGLGRGTTVLCNKQLRTILPRFLSFQSVINFFHSQVTISPRFSWLMFMVFKHIT